MVATDGCRSSRAAASSGLCDVLLSWFGSSCWRNEEHNLVITSPNGTMSNIPLPQLYSKLALDDQSICGA